MGQLYGFIPVDSQMVPCIVTVKLIDQTYQLDFRYNEEGGFFTVGLATVTPGDNTLCHGEVIRYGKPLFEQFNDERYPLPLIIPYCFEGEETVITFDNFGGSVKLWVTER